MRRYAGTQTAPGTPYSISTSASAPAPPRRVSTAVYEEATPDAGASVLARGIVGDVGGEPVIASPIFKQHFALVDGRCLEDDGVAVATYPVRVVSGTVEVGRP